MLRADPFERGPEGGEYTDWLAHRFFLFRTGAGHRGEVGGELQEVSPARQGEEFRYE